MQDVGENQFLVLLLMMDAEFDKGQRLRQRASWLSRRCIASSTCSR